MNIEETCKRLLNILREDPTKEFLDGEEFAKEYLYTLRLVTWANRIVEEMSPELRIALHGHHIYRWRIPRNEFPMDRAGYNAWRTKLILLHAEETGIILESEGYPTEFMQRVKDIIRKRGLNNDPEVQCFEDAINLCFLEFYMDDFMRKHEHAKLVNISVKILNKMSRKAIDLAGQIEMSEKQKVILAEAMEIYTA